MACSCRKGARCLACIEADGKTKTQPDELSLHELSAIVGDYLAQGRKVPSRYVAEMRSRDLVWFVSERRLMPRPRERVTLSR